MSFNKIIVVGNLGRDPELRYTPQGKAVCDFTVATNEKRKDKAGELQDVTIWFKVSLWERQAETAAKYLKKGSQVYIEGRLSVEEWTDRDNATRYSLEVKFAEMQFIGGGSRDNGGSVGGEDASERSSAEPDPDAAHCSAGVVSDDDIPF